MDEYEIWLAEIAIWENEGGFSPPAHEGAPVVRRAAEIASQMGLRRGESIVAVPAGSQSGILFQGSKGRGNG